MATARDKLIADWRGRLAAAEAMDLSAPSRPAWLARMQIRLYRFLLSLYGESTWTTSPPPQRRRRAAEGETNRDGVVFDSPGVLPLCGKPAKSTGKIQAVLKAVANAQDAAPVAGPLAGGMPPDSWMLVAALLSHSEAQGMAGLLRDRKIRVRTIVRGQQSCVEVLSFDYAEAADVLARRRFRHKRSLLDNRIVECAWHCFGVGILLGPFVGLLAVALAGSISQPHKAIVFLCALSLTMLAAAISYVIPSVRRLIPWVR